MGKTETSWHKKQHQAQFQNLEICQRFYKRHSSICVPAQEKQKITATEGQPTTQNETINMDRTDGWLIHKPDTKP